MDTLALVNTMAKTMTEAIRNGNTIYIEDIEVLEKAVKELGKIVGKLDSIEMQQCNKFIEFLYSNYGRTRSEEIEEIEKEHEQKDLEWKCDLCPKQYGCIKELKEHKKEYHEWNCDRCKKPICRYKGAR